MIPNLGIQMDQLYLNNISNIFDPAQNILVYLFLIKWYHLLKIKLVSFKRNKTNRPQTQTVICQHNLLSKCQDLFVDFLQKILISVLLKVSFPIRNINFCLTKGIFPNKKY